MSYEDIAKKSKELLNAVMQSGLPVIIFNKPVKDPKTEENLWDIKIFWRIPDEKESEGFDDTLECFEDCLKYIENYDKV